MLLVVAVILETLIIFLLVTIYLLAIAVKSMRKGKLLSRMGRF